MERIDSYKALVSKYKIYSYAEGLWDCSHLAVIAKDEMFQELYDAHFAEITTEDGRIEMSELGEYLEGFSPLKCFKMGLSARDDDDDAGFNFDKKYFFRNEYTRGGIRSTDCHSFWANQKPWIRDYLQNQHSVRLDPLKHLAIDEDEPWELAGLWIAYVCDDYISLRRELIIDARNATSIIKESIKDAIEAWGEIIEYHSEEGSGEIVFQNNMFIQYRMVDFDIASLFTDELE